MKFSINKLGPITKAELELGNITVLLGPPNVGKSYTLKSIYASLIMLDSTARTLLLKSFSNDLISFVRPVGLLSTLLPIIYYFSPKKEVITNIYRDKIGGIKDISIKQENEKIVAVLEVRHLLSLAKLNKLIREKVNKLCDVVPIDKDTKITMVPSLVKALPSLLEMSLKEVVSFKQVQMKEHDEKLKYKFTCEISPQFQDKKKALEISLLIKTQLDTKSPLCRKRRLKRSVETLLALCEHEHRESKLKKIDVENMLPDIIEFLPAMEIPMRYSNKIEKTTNKFVNDLLDKIGETIENACGLGFYTAVFLPFGRSPFVYQLDSMAQEPSRWKLFEDIYKTDVISRSYMSRLSKGRCKLLDGSYKKEVSEIFGPLLQGNLTFDEKTKEIKYKQKQLGEKGISLKWASALAGEITGILLPLFDVKNPALLIIEEPESQLHYSAHILMALTLIALSKLCKHRIILSTHSDMLALALAYVEKYKPDKDKIAELVKGVLQLQGIHNKNINVNSFVKYVSQAEDITIKFYYYEPKPEGTKVSKKNSSEIIDEVPGITQVVDILATWGTNL